MSDPNAQPDPVDDRDLAIEEALNAAAAGQDAPDDELSAAKREAQEAQQQTLRAQAELENVRKRLRREQQEERRYAALPLVRDLLPMIDNLERAVAAVDVADCPPGFVEGIQMVVSQIVETLAQHHCQRIDPLGETFDPMRHEAVGQQPSDEHPAGIVMQVVQVGYILHDRVVRPAHVIVSQGAPG